MALPAPSAQQDFPAIVGAVVRRFMKARIEIHNPDAPGDTLLPGGALFPGTTLLPGDGDTLLPGIEPYDPVTGEGGIPARVQHLRTPQETSSAVQFSTEIAIQVQIPLAEAPTFILKGHIVKVVDCPDDRLLEKFAYPVLSAVNSSNAAVRTIQCRSELVPVGV